MTDIRIVRDYPHPPAKVWRAVTDPDLIPLWTATGQGGRPVGFSTEVGTRFRFVAKPRPGWRGIVDCQVLETREPSLLRFSWIGDENGEVTYVTYRIEPHAGGTRFTYEHAGFTGVGGFLLAKLLGSVRRKMLTVGLPAVLDDLDDVNTEKTGLAAFHRHATGPAVVPAGEDRRRHRDEGEQAHHPPLGGPVAAVGVD